MKITAKKFKREARHRRIRSKISGTLKRPRLAIFRSLKNIYAQLIDDEKGLTLISASSLEFKKSKKSKSDAAMKLGQLIAERAKEKGLKQVVFDRGGFIFHGRVKKIADAAKEAGLNF